MSEFMLVFIFLSRSNVMISLTVACPDEPVILRFHESRHVALLNLIKSY